MKKKRFKYNNIKPKCLDTYIGAHIRVPSPIIDQYQQPPKVGFNELGST